MKTTFITLTLFLQLLMVLGQNNWIQKTDYGGCERYMAFAFVINEKSYVGGGNSSLTSCNDNEMWEYDPITDQWIQKQELPVDPYDIKAFSVGEFGYIIATISIGSKTLETQVWQYNPSVDQWLQKDIFPGESRTAAVALNIGDKGYYGLGKTLGGTLKEDFWEYDPMLDQWTQKVDMPVGRRAATAFSIGLKGYIGIGSDMSDFWEYNTETNDWIQKTDFGGTARQFAVGFSIGSNGYVGSGLDENYRNDFWEYNSINDTWQQIDDLPGPVRQTAVAFTINNKGYITMGYYEDMYDIVALKDLWEYVPSTSSIETSFVNSELHIYPCPTIGEIEIMSRKGKITEISVFNLSGKIVMNKNNLSSENISIDLSKEPKGIYLIEVVGKGFLNLEKIIKR